MKVAIILMTILGCDDSGTMCKPVAMLPETYTSVAACDQASEAMLDQYQNVPYPMVVAVCQSPDAGKQALSTAGEPPPASSQGFLEDLASSAVDLVTSALPTAEGLKTIVEKPVHMATDTYSWVARKISGKP